MGQARARERKICRVHSSGLGELYTAPNRFLMGVNKMEDRFQRRELGHTIEQVGVLLLYGMGSACFTDSLFFGGSKDLLALHIPRGSKILGGFKHFVKCGALLTGHIRFLRSQRPNIRPECACGECKRPKHRHLHQLI